jgi:hypothetical protein
MRRFVESLSQRATERFPLVYFVLALSTLIPSRGRRPEKPSLRVLGTVTSRKAATEERQSIEGVAADAGRDCAVSAARRTGTAGRRNAVARQATAAARADFIRRANGTPTGRFDAAQATDRCDKVSVLNQLAKRPHDRAASAADAPTSEVKVVRAFDTEHSVDPRERERPRQRLLDVAAIVGAREAILNRDWSASVSGKRVAPWPEARCERETHRGSLHGPPGLSKGGLEGATGGDRPCEKHPRAQRRDKATRGNGLTG